MIIKYRIVKVEDTGQRKIIKSFSDVLEAIEFRKTLNSGEFSFYEIEVCYWEK